MKFGRCAVLAAIATVMVWGSVVASRAPTDMVRSMLDDVMAVQSDPKLAGPQFRNDRREQIRKIIGKNFDFEAMARQALGDQWNALAPAKRTEFRNVFQDLFLSSYSRLVLDFLKKEEVQYVGENTEKGSATVRTVLKRASEQIPVDYVLTAPDKGWLARDVKVDGVSIVDNYHRSFARIIKQESFEGLLKKMKLQQQAESAGAGK